MNKDLFNYHLKNKGITQMVIAESLGITVQSLQNRLTGKVDWNLKEIKTVQGVLKLKQEEIDRIFFA